MTVHQDLARAAPPGDTVLTIGTFDGVHTGHQWLLQHVKSKAAENGLVPAVVTFRNHPRSVLNPDVAISYITTLDERVTLLQGQGIDVVVAVDFTHELSLLKAPEFVALLSRHLRMKGLVVGPDFALGHRREGDVAELRRLGSEMGFWVETVKAAMIGENPIKSSAIRGMVARGEVKAASSMLGRWYSLTGLVVAGERRGRLLGFPTANLSLDRAITIPADGIYATWAIVGGRRCEAATCIGVRPTFGESERMVEAFILDFDEELYGESLTLEFADRLRDELAFPTVDALVDQMKEDVVQARVLLSRSQGPAAGRT